MAGDPSNFLVGTTQTIPCYSVTTGSFAPSCTNVQPGAGSPGSASFVSNMPAACVAAASGEATNPNVPVGDKNATGLKALANFGCYFQNGSAIVPPAQGTIGTMSRDALRAVPFKEWDMSVSKSFRLNERLTAQFRAEAFNIVNITQFAVPSSNPNTPSTFGVAQGTPNSNNPVVGEGGPRQVQFGLKLIF
jgi:hypothetical protein